MEQDGQSRTGKKRPLNPNDTISSENGPDGAAKKALISSEYEDVSSPLGLEKKRIGKSKNTKRSTEGDQKKKGADQANFPEKLMQLINDNLDPEHVSWIDNEEAISFKTEGFQEQVLDKFFQGLKYDSFVRKLNRWGFRRVTSEGVPAGHVAYYHNSFRKDEQELLRTMGIGKKNDPEVQDLQGFGGEQSLIGSAASAAVAASRSSGTGEDGGLATPNPYPAMGLDRHRLNTAVARQQLMGIEDQIGGYPTSLRSSGTLSSSTRQESKIDAAGSSFRQPGTDYHQLLLETMLARQQQADGATLQEREAATLAESLFLRQTHEQQRANLAISSALAITREDDLALKLAALAAQRNALGLPLQPRGFFAQQPAASIPSEFWTNSANLTIEAMLRQRSQLYIPAAAAASVGMGSNTNLQSNLNALSSLANVNIQENPNRNIQGNLNPLANAAANPNNTQGNANLDELWRMLLQKRQNDAKGPGQGPQR